MKSVILTISILLTPFVRTDVMEFILPADFESGWSCDFKPEIYTPADLHEYINGEAELYKQYNFIEMGTVSYVLNENPSFTFTVDIYDMGTALNAFGIYSYSRRPDMNFVEIGEQAIVSDLSIRFWKGCYFIKIVAGGDNARLSQTIRRMAVQIGATLPAQPSPELFKLLPVEHQVANSLKYIKSTYLDIKNSTVLEARYQICEESCFVFILFYENETSAREHSFQLKDNKTLRIKRVHDKIYGVRDFTTDEMADYMLNQFP